MRRATANKASIVNVNTARVAEAKVSKAVTVHVNNAKAVKVGKS